MTEPPTQTPRMTSQTQDILAVLLADPSASLYGFQIAQATELPVATVYPTLKRLVSAEWLRDHMEEPAEAEKDGRPRRRYYSLTREGAARARHALAEQARRRERLTGGIGRHAPGAVQPEGGTA